MTPEQQKALALARARRRREAETAQPAEKGMIFPISRDEKGNVSFDSDAGLLGVAKRAFMLPGQAMNGEVDPMSPEGIERAAEFASMLTPINPAVRAGEWAIPGVSNSLKKPALKAPTEAALRDAAKIDYDRVANSAVDYKTSAVNGLSGEIQTKLTDDGIISELAPKTWAVLSKLSEAPEGSVASVSGLQAARRAFGNAAKDFANPTEQLAAKRAMESLDQFISRSDPATIQSGDASEVAGLLDSARGNYSAYKRSQTLSGLDDAAQLRANAANSGHNAGNTARQRIASLLLNNKKAAQFGKEDIAELRAVNEGSLAANATRSAGNLLGGGGGLGAMLTSGAGAIPGILSSSPELTAVGAVALPALGRMSKEASNVLTERALQQVGESTRKRSPLYEAMLKAAPSEAVLPEKKLAIIRALMMGYNQGSQSGGGW